VEDVRQTPVELPSTSDDSSEDPLQLVSCSSQHIREQCAAYTLVLCCQTISTDCFQSCPQASALMASQ